MTDTEGKKGPSPFDYSKSILNSTAPIPVSEAYIPYIVNRAVAHHRDCIFICQMANEFNLPPEQQYVFLFNQVTKYRRPFERWVSAKKGKETTSDLEFLSKYYQCSIEVASQYIELMTPNDIEVLRSLYGGKESGETPTTHSGDPEMP